MITAEEAHKITKKYLYARKRTFISIHSIENIAEFGFLSQKEILYGRYEGKLIDVYRVGYTRIWGSEEKKLVINIDANTGEVLNLMALLKNWKTTRKNNIYSFDMLKNYFGNRLKRHTEEELGNSVVRKLYNTK